MRLLNESIHESAPPPVAGQEAGVEVADLSYSYGAKRALDGVTLSIRPGRFTALLGPNGAGKTTLVALLSRLIVAPRGRITILGADLRAAPYRALASMGIVFQQQTLDLDLTVKQNMAYFARLHGLGGVAGATGIEAALERMGLAERAGERARELNGGHRRRLEIARALLHEPRFLLLDEPTVGLDVASRAALVEEVHALAEQRRLAVLWATHLVDEVREGDDLIVLHEGRVRAAGPLSEVLKEHGESSVLALFQRLTAV
jgi:ABC-2 type transport system ATP-binding protein